ncbi:hypothetical protein [Lysobacter gummosus]
MPEQFRLRVESGLRRTTNSESVSGDQNSDAAIRPRGRCHRARR